MYQHDPKNTPKIRIHSAKTKARRRKSHGTIILFENPFPSEISIDYHHLLNNIDDENSYQTFMIPLPRLIHRFKGGSTSNKGHWIYCDKWIKKLYCIDIKELLIE